MEKSNRTIEMQQHDDEDRLSELPEHVRHYILSFLPPHESMKTSLLSRTLRDGWLSLPWLDLSRPLFSHIAKDLPSYITYSAAAAIQNDRYLDLIDQIMAMRCQSDDHRYRSMESLILYIPIISRKAICCLQRWIDWAVNVFHVKDLYLSTDCAEIPEKEAPFSNLYELPMSILDSAQQQVISCLTLRSCMFDRPLKTKWPTLKTLWLISVNLDQEMLDSITTNCPLIEYLELSGCCGQCDSLNASGLKRLDTVYIMYRYNAFKRIEIDAPNLKRFSYHSYGSTLSSTELCINNLGASKRLKTLSISNTGLTDNWVNSTLAQLSKLKILFLRNCHEVKYITISSTSLRRITVDNCVKLVQIKIDAPRLEFLGYTHPDLGRDFPSLQLINTNALSSATASFDFSSWNDDVSYEKFVKFLINFNGFHKIEVQDVNITLGLIEEEMASLLGLREVASPPLYNVKHLIFSYEEFVHKLPEFKPSRLIEFVKSLLWLSPHPETISISPDSSMDKRTMLKFKYKEDGDSSMEKCSRCESLPVRCWQHCLEELTIVNEGVVDQEISIRETINDELKKFFQSAMTWKIAVHIISKK